MGRLALEARAKLGQLAGGRAAKPHQRLERLAHHLAVGLRDEDPAGCPQPDLDHAHHLEHAQRLAHGRSTDPERLREVALVGEAITALVAARDDRVLDLAQDLVERAVAPHGSEYA